MTPEIPSEQQEKTLEATISSTNILASTTSAGTQVIPSPALATEPSKFQKAMMVLEALEPLILAGVSPFIKNQHTQEIVANEDPEAQALLQVLAAL